MPKLLDTPAHLYTLEYANALVQQLQTEEEDGWTYVAILAPVAGKATVAAYDEDGQFAAQF